MMTKNAKTKLSKFALLNFAILASFTVFFLVKQNYEFIVYVITLGPLIYIIEKTDRRFNYAKLAKIGFTFWLLSHLIGGSLYINGVRLYDTVLVKILGQPYDVLKYDQAVHIFCYFVMTFFIYSIVRNISRKDASIFTVILIIALASMGVSAANEIIEFSAVVFFDSKGVGDYYNNALDLVFNFIGILLAILTMKKMGYWGAIRKNL